jgi:hypothetical protein
MGCRTLSDILTLHPGVSLFLPYHYLLATRRRSCSSGTRHTVIIVPECGHFCNGYPCSHASLHIWQSEIILFSLLVTSSRPVLRWRGRSVAPKTPDREHQKRLQCQPPHPGPHHLPHHDEARRASHRADGRARHRHRRLHSRPVSFNPTTDPTKEGLPSPPVCASISWAIQPQPSGDGQALQSELSSSASP